MNSNASNLALIFVRIKGLWKSQNCTGNAIFGIWK
jgi:hypothetical protein